MKCFFTALFKFIKCYKQKAAFDMIKSGFFVESAVRIMSVS
ncbi:hypothetical protein HMPREF9064_0311 [Aggregatibacter segnis ATCC 33393]|uniref:Uncharacterized protein n=1 Tax=Aggregatibacter segnis ATCC 33393 TaxID=888057 RepID=E6KVX9_9PAST|nr:hypothetical protein HMPREF9064_0311 [Aggregatibacter segnis ATCC 33393]